MCIRDSVGDGALETETEARVRDGAVAAQVAVPAVVLAIEPVSYTHLRAHETVLDLVCRLLLEKKNKERTHN